MPQPLKIIKGDTTEQQIVSIDKILKSFQGRLSKKVVSLTPPVPIIASCVKPLDGRIFAGIIPFSGIMNVFCISVSRMLTKEPIIVVSANHRRGASYTREFIMKRNTHVFDLDMDIQTGDIFRITEKAAGSVEDVLLGALIHPTMDKVSKETQILSQILSLQERENAEEETEE